MQTVKQRTEKRICKRILVKIIS